MKTRLWRCWIGSVLVGAVSCLSAPGQAAPRDGSHDFDFNFGVWKTHIQRVVHPLSGSSETIELEGTVSVRKVWDGRALLEEIEADGPKGHWEALTLFLYNPASHQWSMSYINSARGVLNGAMTGEFKDGRVELFSQDTVDDRSILVRGVWSDITPTSHRYQESYSDDGGKTWARAFTANLTRLKTVADERDAPAPQGANHDFDFDFGTWKMHSSRLLHPLTGSTEWVDMDGVTNVGKVWGGRANLAEVKADSARGPLEILALRWYNPTTHQWNLDFANARLGTLGVPAAGEFKNGRCDFYDQETIDGKAILVRFSIWEVNADAAQSEQAFSEDGGKTWEVNWKTTYTRIGSS